MLQILREHTKPIQIVAASAVSKGDVIAGAGIFFVAGKDEDAGLPIPVYIDGEFLAPAVATETANIGDIAYWDATNKVVTTSDNDGANKRIGVFQNAKADGETEVRILLNR